MEANKMMTGNEVMTALNVSHMTIYNWRQKKEIKAHTIKGSRSVYYDPKQVLALAKNRGLRLTMKDINQIVKTRVVAKPGPKPKAAKVAATSTKAPTAPKRRLKAKMAVAAKASRKVRPTLAQIERVAELGTSLP